MSGVYNEDDSNVIYVITGIARKSQIETAFKNAISKLQIPCRFRVNLLLDRDGKRLGYAYIWISSMEVVYALLGKNTDGTERVEKYDDPDWVPPKISFDEAVAQAEAEDNSDSSGSWADTVDPIEIKKMYECPKKTRKLEPLVVIDDYEYDDDQLKFIEMKSDEVLTVDLVSTDNNEAIKNVPTHGNFELSMAFHPPVNNEYYGHVLICRKIPSWIGEKELKRIFGLYVTSQNVIKDNKQGSNVKQYPLINILEKNDGSRMVFVTFDPSTNDGKMAYHMTRRITVYDSRDKDKVVSLVFNFAYNKNSHESDE